MKFRVKPKKWKGLWGIFNYLVFGRYKYLGEDTDEWMELKVKHDREMFELAKKNQERQLKQREE